MLEDGQAAVVEGRLQFQLLGWKEDLRFEGGGDELAGSRRQVGEVADRSRARPAGSAEGLAHQIGDVGLAVVASGFSGLHEHGLHNNWCAPEWSTYVLKIIAILLATHFGKTQAFLRF